MTMAPANCLIFTLTLIEFAKAQVGKEMGEKGKIKLIKLIL